MFLQDFHHTTQTPSLGQTNRAYIPHNINKSNRALLSKHAVEPRCIRPWRELRFAALENHAPRVTTCLPYAFPRLRHFLLQRGCRAGKRLHHLPQTKQRRRTQVSAIQGYGIVNVSHKHGPCLQEGVRVDGLADRELADD
ncbi:hypothetical protein M405DRAFT_822936 [Rhizopogon salebrosus TDB-379]|nr:hypothetical protein M405DRAFT_822936 [Rhizopogon salebrosus TDB-379]